MSRETEQRLGEIATWYFYNRDTLDKNNLRKRIDFQEKALNCFLELLTRAIEDIRLCENRPKSQHLWLPNGMKVQGDVRDFE